MPKVTGAAKMLERAGIVFTVHSYNYGPAASASAFRQPKP